MLVYNLSVATTPTNLTEKKTADFLEREQLLLKFLVPK
jgi:hypothetical protein